MIKDCTVPEIWRLMAVIGIFHFGQFFALLPPNSSKNGNIYIYKRKKQETSSIYTSVLKIMIIGYTVPEIWCVTDVIGIFHFGQFFALYPCNSPKNGNIYIKKKKPTGDIINLHMCTKNHDHMLYCSWDMVYDGCNWYFHLGQFFALLPPTPPPSP